MAMLSAAIRPPGRTQVAHVAFLVRVEQHEIDRALELLDVLVRVTDDDAHQGADAGFLEVLPSLFGPAGIDLEGGQPASGVSQAQAGPEARVACGRADLDDVPGRGGLHQQAEHPSVHGIHRLVQLAVGDHPVQHLEDLGLGRCRSHGSHVGHRGPMTSLSAGDGRQPHDEQERSECAASHVSSPRLMRA
jgi:hypothetical protein